MANAIQIESADNVVVLIEDVKAGEKVTIHEKQDSYVAQENIAKGHKMAIVPIKKGEQVIKYGIPIGPMMADVSAGDWISEHNLLNDARKSGEEARKRVRNGGRKIMVYPRADGRFGIRNYVMVIPTSPECNVAAEAISDATGCAWICCDRPHLENGRVSDYSCKALAYTGCNPNVHSALVLKADGEKKTADYVYHLVDKTKKPVRYLDVSAAGDTAVREGTVIVKEFQAAAAAQKREPRPIDGLTITIANSGSDWTTAIFGNPTVGKAMDLLIRDGGCVLNGAMGGLLSGLEDIMALKFAKREDALRMLDLVENARELILKESGVPLEGVEPSTVNKPEGITTAPEKGYQGIRLLGESPIQGILEYCEQPPGNGLWKTLFENGLPPTTACYGSLQGAHLYLHITSAGYLYYEIPHLVGIRVTGNEDTFNTPEFKKDFNAGIAFREGIQKAGEKLYQLILDAAEGKLETNTEKNKSRVFHMWYYVPIKPYDADDRSKIPPFYSGVEAAEKKFGKGFSGLGANIYSKNYAEAVKKYTDFAK
jgi:altronate hydrolase